MIFSKKRYAQEESRVTCPGEPKLLQKPKNRLPSNFRKRRRIKLYRPGASPLMRERRIIRIYDAQDACYLQTVV